MEGKRQNQSVGEDSLSPPKFQNYPITEAARNQYGASNFCSAVYCCPAHGGLDPIMDAQRWRNPKCNGRLPPGSTGLPFIGETLQFLNPSKSIDIPPYRTMK
ncbi:hypothetical protein CRG98_006530 [Punica granatum]|uniref:Uncharacterized protein n=1 Tax=Punica granatum TaxID=22663 RepID=A0A2I0KX93_PUNGR|nr:hypothetical protein CRG98_006530 [Punica granatum]